MAIGGAELTNRPENEALHDYVLSLSAAEEPRICLLPTASGDPEEQIAAFHTAMSRRPCAPSSISLFRLGTAPVDLPGHLLAQDVIYVGGGSMVNLLALWHEHRIDRILHSAHARGIILCGYSAGSMCWFEQGVSRGGGRPMPRAGLGLLGGSHCVHYSQNPDRRNAYRRLVGSGEIPPGLALDDHAAVLFRGGRTADVVVAHERAAAFWVERAGPAAATERRLGARLLASPSPAREHPELEEMRELRRHRSTAASGSSRHRH